MEAVGFRSLLATAFLRRWLDRLSILTGSLFGIFVLSELGAKEVYPWESRWHLAPWFAVGMVSLFGSRIASRNRKLGGLVFLGAAPAVLVIGLVIDRSTGSAAKAWLAPLPLLSFGLFWRLTGCVAWPPLVVGPASRGRKVLSSAMAFLSVAGLSVVGATVVTMLSKGSAVDCGPKPPFANEQYEGQAVFVATLSDPGIAVVKERFWGLPAAGSRLVLIAHWGTRRSELDRKTYFVDGHRLLGLVTRFLPIVEISNCGRSRPIDRAALDIRMLREAPSRSGVRIVCQVTGMSHKPRPGAKVTISGPMESTSTTDREGIADMADLPPGRYAAHIEGCDESKNPIYFRCSDSSRSGLKPGDVWGVELRTN